MLQLVPTNWYALPHTYFVQIVLSDNEWDQVRDTNDHRLCIGVLPFHKQGTQTFTAANNCRDVLSALQLMLHLQLEPYNIDADNSAVQSTNHTSGNIATDLFMSLVHRDNNTIMCVLLWRRKSFLNWDILS